MTKHPAEYLKGITPHKDKAAKSSRLKQTDGVPELKKQNLQIDASASANIIQLGMAIPLATQLSAGSVGFSLAFFSVRVQQYCRSFQAKNSELQSSKRFESR